MASPLELCMCVATVTGMHFAAVDSTYKLLRAERLVVNNGVGVRGTRVSAKDAAALLTALCGVVHVADSAAAVRRFAKTGFVKALADLIENPTDDGIEVHAEKVIARIGDTIFGKGQSLKAALLADSVQSKSPIEDLGDMSFVRGVSCKTIRAISELLNAQAT